MTTLNILVALCIYALVIVGAIVSKTPAEVCRMTLLGIIARVLLQIMVEVSK